MKNIIILAILIILELVFEDYEYGYLLAYVTIWYAICMLINVDLFIN